jgi:hypothetical protein
LGFAMSASFASINASHAHAANIDLRESAADLLLVERTKEWLLEGDGG